MTLITLALLILGLPLTDPKNNSRETDSREVRIEKGFSIMKTVFDRFHINYEMSRLHKVGYYQESVSDSSSLYYLAEGIVEVYVPSNLDQSENAYIYPIKTQKTAFKAIDEEKLLFGNASDMARSSIWRPHSFLNEKNRNDYTYSFSGESSYKDRDVLVISFEPADGTHGKVKGKIYVDPTYYGIVKIEYTPLINNSRVWKEVFWMEEFDFKKGAYELTQVKFTGTSLLDDFHYEAVLAMDQLETVSQIPQNMEFIGDETPLFDRAEESSNESFWAGYEHLKNLKSVRTQLIANQ